MHTHTCQCCFDYVYQYVHVYARAHARPPVPRYVYMVVCMHDNPPQCVYTVARVYTRVSGCECGYVHVYA